MGSDHPDYATYLNNLAELMQDTGRLDEAEPLFLEALAVFEKVLGGSTNTQLELEETSKLCSPNSPTSLLAICHPSGALCRRIHEVKERARQ